jgi:hypothetical protein
MPRTQICGTQTCHISFISVKYLPPPTPPPPPTHTQFYLLIFVVGLGLDDLAFDAGQGQEMFLIFRMCRLAVGPTRGVQLAVHRQPVSGAVPPQPLRASFQFPHRPNLCLATACCYSPTANRVLAAAAAVQCAVKWQCLENVQLF